MLLYMETDTSGVALLQVRDNLNCGYNGASDNAVLQPIAFANKSLCSAERQYSNIERSTQNSAQVGEIPPTLLLCM